LSGRRVAGYIYNSKQMGLICFFLVCDRPYRVITVDTRSSVAKTVRRVSTNALTWLPGPLPLATPESRAHGRSLARPKSRWICAARVAKTLEPLFAVPTGPDLGRVAGHVTVASLVTCLARP
jgi:hypothetical protein